MYVRVEGNTDNVGDQRQNLTLSERRAKSVVDYLVAKGINNARITARGNGDVNPLGSTRPMMAEPLIVERTSCLSAARLNKG